MAEDLLFRFLGLLEGLGLGLPALAWLTVAGGTTGMAYALRGEKRVAIWGPAVLVALVALAANLADYFATLHRSPDLSLEANPIWRLVVDHFGLTAAKWYGLTGKLLVSALAGQMYAYFLANRWRLHPIKAGSFTQFLRRLGNRSQSLQERLLALFTMFAFFFAGIQLLFFYVAYLNLLENPEAFEGLPSFPVSIVLLVALLGLALVALTYRDYKIATR